MRNAIALGLVSIAACGEVKGQSPDASSVEMATLSVSRTGNGTITSTPGGIDCGGSCIGTYDVGTSITLTAEADADAAFTGWTGACSGTSATCTINLDGDTAVGATFDDAYALTVVRNGTGTGTVISTPGGISCGSDCSETYLAGTTTAVTLTATADADSSFTGWAGGGCTGTAPCIVTVDDSITVTATFACGGSQTFAFTGAQQSFVAPNCTSTITIDAFGAQGGVGATVGGLGGRARGTATITPGEALIVMVGGLGVAVPTTGNAAGFPGGFNGGGGVREYLTWTTQGEGLAGTGGGASDVRRGGSALANRIIVAGGGGGGGVHAGGGGGGVAGVAGTSGAAGSVNVGGGGGTATVGGTAGNCCGGYPNEPGVLGIGGTAYRDGSGSGGGGGGYFGGGGGQFAGGGGGSSFLGTLTTTTTTAATRTGNGVVTITW